jgi:peptidyl-prolyl cis-trans isomerase A (cyclophilin A)
MRPFTILALSILFACKSSTPTEDTAAKEKPADKKPLADEAKEAKEAKEDAKKAEPEAEVDPRLLDPSKATKEAPAKYKVKFETTKGDFVVQVNKSWAPLAADRFYNLVDIGYYDDVAFFRAIDGFMVQFGIHGTPKVNRAWRSARIKDDPVKKSNKKGFITFATSGPDSRTSQVFINYGDNKPLDKMGFAPFGKVVEGMDVVEGLHKGYGEGAPKGKGPAQSKLQSRGNEYLEEEFPKLDYVKKATLVEE